MIAGGRSFPGPVAVLGLGIEGQDLARWLLAQGARVTVFDTRSRAAVASAAADVEALGAEVRIGPLDPTDAERFGELYVSQSVLVHREPFVQHMRALGRPISSMLREFMRRWPGPIAAITGSSGKTTTTALVAAAFAAAGRKHIVGGNMGMGLLGQLAAGRPETWAVLEISHTQLQLLERGPHIAAVTNVTPNHLDQFEWGAYVELKRKLVRLQSARDYTILNAQDPQSLLFCNGIESRCVWFNGGPATAERYVCEGDLLVRRADGTMTAILLRSEVPLRGEHNLENVLAAAAVCGTAGLPLAVFGDAVRGFRAVAHRLEVVAEVGGVTYVNDSIATSPERTLAGMRSFSEPLVLLLGGREKQLPLDALVRACNAHAHTVVLFGEAAGLLACAFEQCADRGERSTVVRADTLAEATAEAARRAHPGDVVLLSPACASFDAYPNFERRGEEFRRLVGQIAATTSTALAIAAGLAGKEGTPSPR